jgi:hypothetical protein
VVTVGGMAGAACAEWHLHAWDLARALGKDYFPADPDILAAGWQAGMPHLPLGVPVAVATCGAGPVGGGVVTEAQGGGAWPAGLAGPAGTGAWRSLLRASGRLA